MSIKRTATWLVAWGALVWLTGQALAQPPANSNLEYQTPTPNYENGNAPFSNANPENHRSFLPFNPVNFEPKLDLFGPAETSGYGNGPRARIGYFGSYERVFWSLSKPSVTKIGSPTAEGVTQSSFFFFNQPTINTNAADTGFLTANGAWGNRYEIGYVDTDNYGWLVGVLDHVAQAQFHEVRGANVLFDDPGNLISQFVPTSIINNNGQFQIIDADLNNNNIFGRFGQDIGRPNPNPPPAFIPPRDGIPDIPAPTDTGDLVRTPTVFRSLQIKNKATVNGVELMRLYRAPRLHNGGFFELLYGARWFQLDDVFVVFGTNMTTDVGTMMTGTSSSTIVIENPLVNATWSTRAQNNLVGPQIGGRWSHQRGRWVTSFEARAMAAVDFQNVHQKTSLATLEAQNLALLNPGGTTPLIGNTLNLINGLGTDTHRFSQTIAPLGEIRAQTTFQVTSTVGIKVGYTGLFVGNITRASNHIDYSGPNLISILPGANHQIFFSNGVNVGVEVNR